MSRLRRSTSLFVLLALTLVVGPAALAACPHLGMDEEVEATAHDMGAMDSMDGEMPCHETPEAPAEESDADCLSPCCTIGAPAPVQSPAVPDALASVPLLAPVAAAPVAEAAIEALLAPMPPPGPPLRVHLLLGRFLT